MRVTAGHLLERAGRHFNAILAAIALLGLVAGIVTALAGAPEPASFTWTIATLPVLSALLFEIVTSLRRGDVGLDVVAALSMSAALLFGEALAGNVVALMYAGGQLLERFAEGRAEIEMKELVGRVARTAMRHRDGTLTEVPIDSIVPGDRLLIRHGEVLPVDGTVSGSAALLDLSALTGESLPEPVTVGREALSGATNVGPPFDLLVTRPAADSTYAGIVRLVETARSAKAPMVRLADRYAMAFLALTLVIAGAAWALSGEPVRALAVLVVATPCPLILAVPVALISGISRSARSGVLVKNGGVLEALARVRTAILDKTGTLTEGRPAVTAIHPEPGVSEEELLALAASLDLASGHVVAPALIEAAAARGLSLQPPVDVSESAGRGLEGTVGSHRVALGGQTYVGVRAGLNGEAPAPPDVTPEAMTVAVAIDGRFAGSIVLTDRVRHDAEASLDALRGAGIGRIVLASGDRSAIAQAVGEKLGVNEVLADLLPGDKVAAVVRERGRGPVLMVGDGVNDAPALAAADVGVALGARGAAASSEAAGVVLLVDQLQPLAAALAIARRTLGIARQSVFAGVGLSVAAMLVAAFGYLPPVGGALLQEAIDVAVILNALRALR